MKPPSLPPQRAAAVDPAVEPPSTGPEAAGPPARRLWKRAGGLSESNPQRRWERFVWMSRLFALARILDRRHATGEAGSRPRSSRLLGAAFEAFLVLVDPRWWRQHPPRELSHEEERRLGELRGNRQRMLFELRNDGWTLLAEILHAAVEAFFRAGFRGRARRLSTDAGSDRGARRGGGAGELKATAAEKDIAGSLG